MVNIITPPFHLYALWNASHFLSLLFLLNVLKLLFYRRGNPAKNQVSHAVRQYDNKTRRGTSKSIFDASTLNDPTAREVPQPDNMPSGSGTSNC